MDMKQHVGAKVRAARAKRGLTQERLGELIDKTAESVSNIERGHVLPPLDTLRRIADCLDVPMTFFFEGMDDERPIARNRLELEHRLRAIGEDLTNEELRIAVAVLDAIRSQRTV